MNVPKKGLVLAPSKHKPKIAVAMSGGVDSSVTAALLKKSGHNIVGVFMRLNSFSKSSEKRAKLVAKTLNIPFKIINFKKEFEKRIIKSFLAEFKAGRTPNPCVICNKQIKFGLLLEEAKALGADLIATGHYARKRELKTQSAKRKVYELLKGKDKAKDQSYFLWQLNQKQLRHILFPLGDYTKKQVREMAEKMNLPTAKTPESQEICFVQTTLAEFLKKNLKTKTGPIVEQAHYGVNKIIGQHQGLCFYTIGQRKNIEIPQGPWYVVSKNVKNNTLVVSQKEKDVFKKEMLLEKVSWVSGKKPKFPLRASIKIRYQHPGYPATIVSQKKVIFARPQRAITPGQSAVFYLKNEILGGGIIQG